MNLILTTPQ